MSPTSAKSGSSVFETGKYTTVLVKAVAETSCLGKNKVTSLTVAPPKQLLIATPSEALGGEFPVLLLLHGYLLYNSFYSQLMQHIASHGFIVIAPQVSHLRSYSLIIQLLLLSLCVCVCVWISFGASSMLHKSFEHDVCLYASI